MVICDVIKNVRVSIEATFLVCSLEGARGVRVDTASGSWQVHLAVSQTSPWTFPRWSVTVSRLWVNPVHTSLGGWWTDFKRMIAYRCLVVTFQSLGYSDAYGGVLSVILVPLIAPQSPTITSLIVTVHTPRWPLSSCLGKHWFGIVIMML